MTTPKRNSACPCGSGKKYKKCCWIAKMAQDSAPFPIPTKAPEKKPEAFNRARNLRLFCAALAALFAAQPRRF